jgi:hypothetical protein
MIVSSFCFALKSMLVTVSAVWPRGHSHRTRLAVPAGQPWGRLAARQARCGCHRFASCVYCRVAHRAALSSPSHHLAPPCSELSQPLTSSTSPLVTYALYSKSVCDAFRRVNLIMHVLCFSACCSYLIKSINN